MKGPDDLRREAARYRRLATQILDRRAIQALTDLAAEYEATAAALERSERIRKRAYQMWEEQGCPHGLRVDHWVAAEHELAEDEEIGTDRNKAHAARRR